MAAAIPVVLGVLGAASSVQSDAADEKSLNNQAVALEVKANETRAEGNEQATAIRAQKDEVIGSTISTAAAAGVVVNTGSVLDAIEESAYNIEMDALTTQESSERQARSYEIEAEQTRAGASSGISTLLSATGSAASGYASGLSLS